MKMADEVALAIAGHAVAKDEIVHSATDIDRINLNETEMAERGSGTENRRIEQECPAMKSPGIERRKTEHSRHLCRLTIGAAVRYSTELELPSFPILPSHILRGLGSIFRAHLRSIPLEFLAGAQRDAT